MSDLLTPDELAVIAEREAKATEGEWRWLFRDKLPIEAWHEPHCLIGANGAKVVISLNDRYQGYPECGEDLRVDIEEADRDFIAHARADIPALLAHIAANAREANGSNFGNLSEETMEVIEGLRGWNNDPKLLSQAGESQLAVLEIADALDNWKTEAEENADLIVSLEAQLAALRKEAAEAIEAAWREGSEQGEKRQSRIFNGFKVDAPRYHTATGPRSIHQADARCPQHGEKRMTTAEVFANYLGLTPANAPWAFEKWRYCTECGMPQVLDEPAPCCPSGHCYHRLTATSPLAPEPTPGWRERLEEHRAFIALERLCAPRMYRATCLIYGNGEDQGETIKFDDTHPTHAVAHALIAADPALRSACERAADYNEKETNNA